MYRPFGRWSARVSAGKFVRLCRVPKWSSRSSLFKGHAELQNFRSGLSPGNPFTALLGVWAIFHIPRNSVGYGFRPVGASEKRVQADLSSFCWQMRLKLEWCT